MHFRLLLPFCLLLAFSACAFAAELPPQLVAGGMTKRPTLLVPHDPSKTLRLEKKENPNEDEKNRIQDARGITNHLSNLALLILKDGKILFEAYNSPANELSPLFSMSMSKSLTAYTLGGLVCAGTVDIKNPVGTYTDELRETTWDTSSVRDVLRMSSGGKIPVYAGQIEKGQFKAATTHQVSVNDIMKRNGERATAPGSSFNYLSVDTSAVERVIAKASGEINLLKEFTNVVWNNVGAEAGGYWNVDKAGAVHAYAGFSATLRDWGRLGLWTLRKMGDGSCLGRWIAEANSPQIVNHRTRQGKAFPNYGYQVWIRKNQYWWVGHGGQRLGVDPKKGVVLVAFSWRADYMKKLYDLMDKF